MGWVETAWHEKSGGELRRVELRRAALEWRIWEGLKRKEARWAEKRWEKLRWHNRWEQLWSAEKSGEEERRHETRWDVVKKAEKTPDEMRWDDTDCSGNGMQWEISKRSCDATRSGEMRKDPTLTRNGTGMKSREIVAARHKGLPAPYRRILCSALLAVGISILKSLSLFHVQPLARIHYPIWSTQRDKWEEMRSCPSPSLTSIYTNL